MTPGQLYQVLSTIRNRFARLGHEQRDTNKDLWRELLGAAELVSHACGATDRFLHREQNGGA